MQTDLAPLLDRLAAEAIPNQRGLAAWRALIHAHATLMRQLATDLVDDIGLTLGDFDVLAQLGHAGGELRINELAAQAYSSRSGMTRRIDRLIDEGMVTRADTHTDGRAVVVALTEAGVDRLPEAAPPASVPCSPAIRGQTQRRGASYSGQCTRKGGC